MPGDKEETQEEAPDASGKSDAAGKPRAEPEVENGKKTIPEIPKEYLKKSKEELAGELLGHKINGEKTFERLQRLQAEFENLQKRTRREVSESCELASSRLIKDLLNVVDDFRQAVSKDVDDETLAPYLQGFKLIHQQIMEVLEREGLAEISATGETFDPFKHEAIEMAPCAEFPEGVVIDEVQKGYSFKSRVLRPSKVRVSAGPPTEADAKPDKGIKNQERPPEETGEVSD